MPLKKYEKYLVKPEKEVAVEEQQDSPPKEIPESYQKYRVAPKKSFSEKYLQQTNPNETFRDAVQQAPIGIIKGLEWLGANLTGQSAFAPPKEEEAPDNIVDAIAESLGYDSSPQTPAGEISRGVAERATESAPLFFSGGIPAVLQQVYGYLAGEGSKQLGASEGVGSVVDTVVSANPKEIAKNLFPSKNPQYTQSGLPIRKVSKTTKPTKVSSSTKTNITQTLEKDFKTLSDKYLSKNTTAKQVIENPNFKTQTSELFEEVDKLIPNTGKIKTSQIKKNFKKRISSAKKQGYADSEFERVYKKETNRVNKSFGNRSVEPKDVLKQYRKNNRELTELFEPGKSGAYNRAKKESLLEHNRAIEDTFSEIYGEDSAFVKLFKKTNNDWEKILNYENIQDTIDKAFVDGKINFNQLNKQIHSKSFQRSLTTLIGKEGAKQYNSLISDFNGLKNPTSLLGIASEQGLNVKDMVAFVTHPKYSKAYLVYKISSKLFKKAQERALTDQVFVRDWKSGINAFTKKDLAKASSIFSRLRKELEEEPKSPSKKSKS